MSILLDAPSYSREKFADAREISQRPTPEPPVQKPPAQAEGPQRTWAQALVLAVLLAAPAVMCVHAGCVADPDIWWHMRIGEWILEHHAVPRAELFSGELAGRSWLAYSWLFELLVVKLFYRFGLVGIVAYSSGMVLAITAALYHLVRRLQSDFTVSVGLTYAALFSMAHLYTPRPWLFSILLFVVELDILMQVRRSGRTRGLLWLPLLFALWANVHIEYIYGLFLVGLAFVESVAARWMPRSAAKVKPIVMGGALLGCIAGTLVNPFGWRIYGVVYELVTQGGGLRQVSEMQAMPFRDIADFFVLFLALAAAGALAWTRRFQLFETGLFGFAAVMSFRSQRDLWLMTTVAAMILASTLWRGSTGPAKLPKRAFGLSLATAALAIMVAFRALHVNNGLLGKQVENLLPVRAVEAIRAGGYAGPLYNDFNWGGYLIWSLRMPVSIDGRTNLYGNERMDRSIATWTAQPDWASDPQLKAAGVIIGPKTSPLIQVLRQTPRFKLVYEDKLAAVFLQPK